MKRTPTGGRAVSPTNTTYSGISNYRTESYRPLKDRNTPASPALDPRIIARTHFEELSRYLASYLAREPANSRSTARQKLTRLTRQQFQELSTDVYDELIRRKNNADSNDIPFLPVRDDFHPKRNQARQKLATLPTSRFKDLSSDVYYELVRRYPEFKEDEPVTDTDLTSPGSTYDDFPSPDFPTSPRTKDPPPPFPGRSSLDRERPPSNPNSDADPYSSRRRPSQDTTATLQQDLGRRPSVTSASDSTSTTNAQSATATSGMIIPNKSTIAEEDIEVPYARRGESSRDRESESEGDAGDEPGGLSGLGGLAHRLREEDEPGVRSGGDEYFDKMSFGRASVTSDRSGKGGVGAVGGRASVGASAEEERMRRDYEFRIATMQSKIAGLEREVEDREEWERKAQESDERVRLLEEELDEVRRRAEEQGMAMRVMQKELDEMREDRERSNDREGRRAREDEEELAILRERCERLEEERTAGGAGGGADAEIVEQLRTDMEGLIAEVSDLSRRNDELMTSKDSDLVVIRDMDAQLKEYKRKYEQAKTELRSVKATSQLFLQKPKFDSEQLPMSSDGLIPDVHLTAFLAAIDALLSAARAPAPTRVLTPMKSVVNSVTAIVEDARGATDISRAEATLGNLVAAARTHATSAGLAPVSLLDAAASHVSAAITEIGRAVRLRRATKTEQDAFVAAGGTLNGSGSSYAPALRSVAEDLKGYQRGQNEVSSSSLSFSGRRSEDRDRAPPPPPPSMSPPGRPPSGRSAGSDRFRSEPSSSDASSPPPIFDVHPSAAAGIVSDDSAVAEGAEDAWTELKPYLEAQTESIVYAIQSVLSGVRSPTPSPTLNENLTQIITIVSSIVAVCHDNLPPSSAKQGGDILRELSEHANKLSEMQALPEVTKESRQIMAKSSFSIANAMKGLQKL